MIRNLLVAAVALLLAGKALAGTPAQKCESGKNKEAGKYGYCRQKAEAKFARRATRRRARGAHEVRLTKYDSSGPGEREQAAGGTCPSTGDQAAIQQYLDTATTNVATALAGGTLPDWPADLLACQGDLGTCNGNLRHVT